MSDIIKGEGQKPMYTVVPNSIITNGILDNWESRLSWMYLYSKQNMNIPWEIHPYDIQKNLGFGDRGWRKAYKELTEKGFLMMEKTGKGTTFSFNSHWEMLVAIKAKSKPTLKMVVDNSGDNL